MTIFASILNDKNLYSDSDSNSDLLLHRPRHGYMTHNLYNYASPPIYSVYLHRHTRTYAPGEDFIISLSRAIK